MKIYFFLGLFMLLFLTSGAVAQTQSSHQKAAENLLLIMGTPKALEDNIQQMLTMQMEQVPALKAAELEVRAFFSKHMNWDAIKGDLIKLYVAEFTEKELKDMTAFFNTPTGKKMASKQSKLAIESMKIGQESLQSHLPELQQIVMDKMKEGN
ncbi:DUF2059 domain-containing protein [Rufibacter roseus]|uniref:DUF2059 domain-containing protein n=1 Tax=Rufibacter roseus TaxID=1567108 RepID=A0ABW2DLG5_9BACT|nr:DUF2059 domain-containing protein [Rufibacter roseus]